MKVECLIKRKGGSVIEFGYPPKVTKFHFKLEPDDDFDAPHVCDVPDNSPYLGKLLAVTEGFRIFGADDGESHEQVPADPYAATNPYADQFENLHLVNPDTVDGRFLAAFARDILEVPASNKARLAEFLNKEFGIEANANRETANNLIRMALAECVKQAKEEAEQLINMQK